MVAALRIFMIVSVLSCLVAPINYAAENEEDDGIEMTQDDDQEIIEDHEGDDNLND